MKTKLEQWQDAHNAVRELNATIEKVAVMLSAKDGFQNPLGDLFNGFAKKTK